MNTRKHLRKSMFIVFIGVIWLYFLTGCVGADRYKKITGQGESNKPIESDKTGKDKPGYEFQYSSATVSSGDNSVNPIVCLVWSNEYENGKITLFVDGSGYSGLINNSTDHHDYPTLFLDGTVTAKSIANDSEIDQSVTVLNTNFEELKTNTSFAELSALAAGEYLIVFDEKTDSRCGDESVKNYWISGYDCIFKLIVDNGNREQQK